MEKPRVVISACLNGYPFRYDGSLISQDEINEFKTQFELINICPEVEIGLGIPRKAIKIIKTGSGMEVRQNETALNLTPKLVAYSDLKLVSLPEVDGFILKARSPSCGIKNTKVFSPDGQLIPGKVDGIFTQAVRQFRPYLPLIDESQLVNPERRWEFLARTQLHFQFRKSAGDINALLEFHSRAKYLLMSISQKDLKTLGQILAGHQKENFTDTVTKYRQAFYLTLTKPIRKTNLLNAFHHIYGYFSSQLNPGQKRAFLNLLEKYRAGKSDSGSIIEALRDYSFHFNLPYLQNQFLICPIQDLIDYSQRKIKHPKGKIRI